MNLKEAVKTAMEIIPYRYNVPGEKVEEAKDEIWSAAKDGTLMKLIEQSEWIPIEERLPETDNYVLLSFANCTLAEVGRYEVDDDGGGAFYAGDDERSCSSYGLFVNAWMPLPKPYREDEQ